MPVSWSRTYCKGQATRADATGWCDGSSDTWANLTVVRSVIRFFHGRKLVMSACQCHPSAITAGRRWSRHVTPLCCGIASAHVARPLHRNRCFLLSSVVTTIGSTHSAYTWKDGQAELVWVVE